MVLRRYTLLRRRRAAFSSREKLRGPSNLRTGGRLRAAVRRGSGLPLARRRSTAECPCPQAERRVGGVGRESGSDECGRRGAPHGGECAAAVAAGVLTREDVTELGHVLAGDAEGRRSDDEATAFDSTGLAQGLAVALVALESADELDLQTIDR
jgi:hypothetical protein